MRKGYLVGIAVAGMMLCGSGAHGQTAWDAPLLLPPRPADGFGIFLADMHEGGVGVLGMWRSSTWNYGLRAAVSEGSGGEGIALSGGVDYSGAVNRSSDDFPLDIDWVFGAGLSIDDGVREGIRVSLPLGLSAAHSFQAESARFTPYITPRVMLDAFFNSNSGRDDLELGLAADLGLDLTFASGGGPFNGLTIRFGATLGDRDAIAVGLVF
jgi:hypothetical protein